MRKKSLTNSLSCSGSKTSTTNVILVFNQRKKKYIIATIMDLLLQPGISDKTKIGNQNRVYSKHYTFILLEFQ